MTSHEQTLQMTLSNARLFIDFSGDGGNALDVTKIISIATLVSASTRGRSTIADCHVRGGSVGCWREASLHHWLVNSFMSKVVILDKSGLLGSQLEMEERVGSQVKIHELQTLGGGAPTKHCSQKHLVSSLCFL